MKNQDEMEILGFKEYNINGIDYIEFVNGERFAYGSDGVEIPELYIQDIIELQENKINYDSKELDALIKKWRKFFKLI